jgi:hypothetical protein
MLAMQQALTDRVLRSDTGYRYAGVDEKDRNRFICPAFEGRLALICLVTLS